MERLTGRVGACVEVLSEAPREGRADHLIRSVWLRMRTGFRRDAMFLISLNCLALLVCKHRVLVRAWFKFRKETLPRRNPSVDGASYESGSAD